MNILKFIPIFLLIGTIAMYCTRSSSERQPSARKKQTISLKITGYGVEQKVAIENAEINAFEALLFKGIPGQATPLVPDALRSRELHQDYYKDLLKNKRYKHFLMGSNPAADDLRQVSRGKIAVDLKVDVEGLRKDLKENNVISI